MHAGSRPHDLRATAPALHPRWNGQMSAPRLRLNPADPRFADAVLADIHRISKSPAGQALFRRLLDVGTSVTTDKPQPPTNPPNAWTRLVDPDRPPRHAVITYDPAHWPPPAALCA